MSQNWFDAFREANPHLFGEDSDFSDSDSENGEIEETQENFQNKISKPRFFQKFQNFFSKKFQKNFFSKKFFFRLEKHSQVASA